MTRRVPTRAIHRLLLVAVALVALPAADCENDNPIAPPSVIGTITGIVTIDSVGALGITVSLSTGPSATTDSSGVYSFSGVPAGAHAVSISGFGADVTFSTTVQIATIATAGQVATVNFDGTTLATARITGTVTVSGAPLAGVTVTLSGTQSGTSNTDGAGGYSFAGLPAGA